MEIPLPIVGLEAQECSLHLDKFGSLWLTNIASDLPVRVDPPAYFRLGPYKFLIREASQPSQNHGVTQKRLRPVHRPKVLAAVLALGLLGGGMWLGIDLWDKNPKERNGAQAVASPVPAPVASNGDRLDADKGVSNSGTERNPEPAVATVKEDAVISENPEASPPPTLHEPEQLDLEKLASTVGPCVFLIQVLDDDGSVRGQGTGFSVTADGLVATNHHVVEHGRRFSLVTGQGAKFDQARVVADDPAGDLAILKIDGKGLPFLALAANSTVPVGKRVAVYGSPSGLAGSLSEGIISALPRDLNEKFPNESVPNHGVLLQTTAAISAGSSGSPLFDSDGKVLGVMTLVLQGSTNPQNLNFAVSVEALRPLIGKASNGVSVNRSGSPNPSPIPERQEADLKFSSDVGFSQLNERMGKGNWVEALKLAGQLTERHPKWPQAHFMRGYCASMLMLYHQAELSYLKAIELEPENYLTWNNLGAALRSHNQPEKAIMAFEKAVSLQPDYPGAWDNIVLTSAMLKNWPKAAVALDTLSWLDPTMARSRAGTFSGYRFPDANFTAALTNVLRRNASKPATGGPVKFTVVGVPSTDPLSMRLGPGTDFARVISIANGSDLTVVGDGQMNGSTEWLPVEYGKWKGWVARKYLRRVE